MRRPLVWLPGVVLLAVVLAALLAEGASRKPAAGRSAPRIVVRSPSVETPSTPASRRGVGPGSPEVIVLGDLAPARSTAPAPARRAASARPRTVHEVLYVDAPAREAAPAPDPGGLPAPGDFETPTPESTELDQAPAASATPPVAPAPAARGSSRTGAIVTGAAIGAGIGAVLGGGRGALRGAIGGAAGGAIGGRSGAVLGGVLGGSSGRSGRVPRAGCYTDDGTTRDRSSITL